MPVYNSKDYLEYALESVVNQNVDFSEVELIIINDGSTDGSVAILEQYASKYPWIKLIHQPNQGSAKARNKGLDLAQGEYIGFLDSDDSIYSNSLDEVLDYLFENNLEVLYLHIHMFDQNGQFIEDALVTGRRGIIEKGLYHTRRTFNATIYKKDLIGNFRFPSNVMIGEDTVFNVKAHFLAERVSYYDTPYYKYTRRDGSLTTQSKTEKAYQGFKNAIIDIRNFETQYSKGSTKEKEYFEKVYHIFITRILELSILPTLDRVKYIEFKSLLYQKGLTRLMKLQDEKYPYFSESFHWFKLLQLWLLFKSKLLKNRIA